MKPIIGLDFGNFNSYTCFISDFDEGTRMGGNIHDLLPERRPEGIPSVYFYSEKVGEVRLGENAVVSMAVPEANRLRYLKRHLGETIVLDDRTISYDEAVTQVAQHCIRKANEVLSANWQMTTELVSLAYPATYTFAQRKRLIDLVEQATLDDGTPVKVYGTIAEPAAAALDYLAEYSGTDGKTTVLTYDLGGGTFDLGLVTAYPNGKKRASGETYYYDIISTRGLSDLGGKEFDEAMYQIMLSKINGELDNITRTRLKSEAEKAKVELSSVDETVQMIMTASGYNQVSVTRDEFEQKTKALIDKTIAETKTMLEQHVSQKPDIILLTGGASQMPMVLRELEQAFPEYAGKIIKFRPAMAIAYGAARFGTEERNEDPVFNPDATAERMVVQRVMFDLGVGYTSSRSNFRNIDHIDVFIPAGTEIPYQSDWRMSETVYENQRISRFSIYEAKAENPDELAVDRDWTAIIGVNLMRTGPVEKGRVGETKLSVDRKGIITIESRDHLGTNGAPVQDSIQLLNLN